ncbi:hypothetical protein CIHG_02341 [Coccidioides immitis H538.4]|uniref:Uncharacterized protein n=1 Tax=Coccidioides immitis H538.4 TaxID=396776 RepID=A0A0J8RI44_COCIT|nr:hypothetical protein CIHG_02341 [Coccidioides immitis H538.4]
MPGREFCFTLAANSRRRRLLFASIMEEQGQSALLCKREPVQAERYGMAGGQSVRHRSISPSGQAGTARPGLPSSLSRSLSRAPQKSHFSSCPRRAFRNHHQARMDPPAPRPDSHARVTDLPRLPTLLWLHRNLERNARSPIGPPPDHIMHRQAALESEPAESDAVFQHALTLWL